VSGAGDQLDSRAIHALKTAEEMEGPRVIKTHLPVDMLPPKVLEVK